MAVPLQHVAPFMSGSWQRNPLPNKRTTETHHKAIKIRKKKIYFFEVNFVFAPSLKVVGSLHISFACYFSNYRCCEVFFYQGCLRLLLQALDMCFRSEEGFFALKMY